MSTLKELAIAYVAPETKVISDLESVSLIEEFVTKTYEKKNENGEPTGETFTVMVITREDEHGNEIDYRVPKTVIGQLNVLLENIDDLDSFRVIKTGSGMNTKYQVIPI
jgi:hypothetical protein